MPSGGKESIISAAIVINLELSEWTRSAAALSEQVHRGVLETQEPFVLPGAGQRGRGTGTAVCCRRPDLLQTPRWTIVQQEPKRWISDPPLRAVKTFQPERSGAQSQHLVLLWIIPVKLNSDF